MTFRPGQPWQKRCPVCGLVMMARRKNAASEKIDRHECPRCNLVIENPEDDFKPDDPPVGRGEGN
jgi:hypothetical protein